MKRYTLRQARERRRLTQEQLARVAGVEQSYISKLESNPDANPTIDIVGKLERGLTLRPGQLAFGQPQDIVS